MVLGDSDYHKKYLSFERTKTSKRLKYEIILFFKSLLSSIPPLANGEKHQTVKQTIIRCKAQKDRNGCSHTGGAVGSSPSFDNYRYSECIKRACEKYQCSLDLPNIFVWENIVAFFIKNN